MAFWAVFPDAKTIMSKFIGLDTSNYTTSVAAFCVETGALWQYKQLLPVKEGELGLRQSDAVFHHTRQLPEQMEYLCSELGDLCDLTAIGVSDRPQEADGSYMPCFLVGLGGARQLAAVLRRPLHIFTHQQGHVAAALYGAGRLSLIENPFLAFHVSGGTTDALLVTPSKETVISCKTVACSLDLKAGQLIDRVGGMLGLPFPAGPALDQLAQTSTMTYSPRPTVKSDGCHLSGVENQCRRLLNDGVLPADIAAFCLHSVRAAVEKMTEQLLAQYGEMPVVYAGGVMSNTLLRKALSSRFGGIFAPPAFSSDNAAGIAVLTALKELGAAQ